MEPILLLPITLIMKNSFFISFHYTLPKLQKLGFPVNQSFCVDPKEFNQKNSPVIFCREMTGLKLINKENYPAIL